MSEVTKTIISLDDLRARRQDILALAAKYGAYNVRVFGSVARGEATAASDVDLLANFREHSLLDRIALMRELSELLAVSVEVIQEKALKPHVKPQALKDAVPL
jgi:uncharacterized protein